jgi:predicted glycosyltransferase
MLRRQWFVARTIRDYRPDVVASLMGSYTQSAKLLGVRNVIFTDSEFQHFNHWIAHPFADEIHTPECFYKELGAKQHRYPGIHEMAFLTSSTYEKEAIDAYVQRDLRKLALVRLSAWNTLHDVGHSGIGDKLSALIDSFDRQFQFLIVAEEGKLPPGLEAYSLQIPPELFHSVLDEADFVLTEGASTASESACLGTPTVYINSTDERGYLRWLEAQGRVHCFKDAALGLSNAREVLNAVATVGERNTNGGIKGFDLVQYVSDALVGARS